MDQVGMAAPIPCNRDYMTTTSEHAMPHGTPITKLRPCMTTKTQRFKKT